MGWRGGEEQRGRDGGGGGGPDVSSQVAPLTSGPSGSPSPGGPLLPLSRQQALLIRGLSEGQSCPALEGQPSLLPGIPSLLEKSRGFFPRPSAWGRGSLGLVTAQPTAHPDEPQPPGSCRAAKRTYPSWYFESGSSHARPSKGWLCAFGPGVGEWGGGKPERLGSKLQA